MQYIPQLYVKLKGWYPPPASLAIEEEITYFKKKDQRGRHSQK
jgi:hypothetical protein